MPVTSPCQGGLPEASTSAPVSPLAPSFKRATPKRRDKRRLRWLVAALQSLSAALTPLEFAVFLTLLYRSQAWPGGHRGVIASHASLAASAGRQRPGRAPQGAPAQPTVALRDAGRFVVVRGLAERWTQTYLSPRHGRIHTEAYRWFLQKPERIDRVHMPAWPDAVHMVRRVAVQQSVHGPTRDMVLVLLALAADEHGHVTATRDELERLCGGLSPDTVLRHLRALAADDYGVTTVMRADDNTRRGHAWHVRLQVIPDGVTPGEARVQAADATWAAYKANKPIASAEDAARFAQVEEYLDMRVAVHAALDAGKLVDEYPQDIVDDCMAERETGREVIPF